DYDGTRERHFASGTAGVPSVAERAGDFGELCTLRGGSFNPTGQCDDNSGQLWDPFDPTNSFDDGEATYVRNTFIPFNNLATYASAGTATPGVAGNTIDPVAFKLMQFYPTPTSDATDAQGRLDNWFRAGVNKSTDNKFDIKIDHSFSQRSLFSI